MRRNVTLPEIEGKEESRRGWRLGIAREREVEIRESEVLNDYYKQTEEKVEKKNMWESEREGGGEERKKR